MTKDRTARLVLSGAAMCGFIFYLNKILPQIFTWNFEPWDLAIAAVLLAFLFVVDGFKLTSELTRLGTECVHCAAVRLAKTLGKLHRLARDNVKPEAFIVPGAIVVACLFIMAVGKWAWIKYNQPEPTIARDLEPKKDQSQIPLPLPRKPADVAAINAAAMHVKNLSIYLPPNMDPLPSCAADCGGPDIDLKKAWNRREKQRSQTRATICARGQSRNRIVNGYACPIHAQQEPFWRPSELIDLFELQPELRG